MLPVSSSLKRGKKRSLMFPHLTCRAVCVESCRNGAFEPPTSKMTTKVNEYKSETSTSDKLTSMRTKQAVILPDYTHLLTCWTICHCI